MSPGWKSGEGKGQERHALHSYRGSTNVLLRCLPSVRPSVRLSVCPVCDPLCRAYQSLMRRPPPMRPPGHLIVDEMGEWTDTPSNALLLRILYCMVNHFSLARRIASQRVHVTSRTTSVVVAGEGRTLSGGLAARRPFATTAGTGTGTGTCSAETRPNPWPS